MLSLVLTSDLIHVIKFRILDADAVAEHIQWCYWN